MSEGSGNFEVSVRGERGDLLFSLDKQAYSGALDAAGTLAPWHLLPDYGTQLEADDAIENLASLLSPYQTHIDMARLFDGCFDGTFGNLMENDAIRLFRVKFQYFTKMPGDCLSFTVFVGCEPDSGCIFYGLFQVSNNLFLIWINFVLCLKPILYVYGRFSALPFFRDSTDMADT